MLHDLSYLPRQDRRRIEAWTEELSRHLYEPIAPLQWEGFVTYEHLSVEEAEKQSYTSYHEGTGWGGKGQYGWFRATYTLAKEYEGKTICSPLGLGGEALVYHDKVAVGSYDRHHRLVYFQFSATAGLHSLLVESYAGSGTLLEGGGPIPPDRSVYPPVAERQQKITNPTVGYLEETAYQLYQDVYTLTSLLTVLEPRSLLAESIVDGLLQFTRIVDFEQEREGRISSFKKARAALAFLLAYRNGTCAPKLSVFGQSHIDLAWKWTKEETKRKCGRTYANQLALLNQYPEYHFLLCEPALLKMLQTYHPDLFTKVLEKVHQGQVYAQGSFWVECDTNLPNAESLVKQLVWGQRWFNTYTGAISRFAWLPDTFGFSASLPQLLVQAGVDSFSTQKLLRSDPESDPFPFTDFWWEGEDGSRILSSMCYRNNCEITASQLYQRWHVDRKQQGSLAGMLYPFGYGDGGGGADRDLVEQMMRLKDLQGVPRLLLEGPNDYMDRVRESVAHVHTGELYLAWHRGTYSSQQVLKQLNHQSEQALYEYAFWSTVLDAESDEALPSWWETVLFNQFHDIISGVSIKEVNQNAERELSDVVEKSRVGLHRLLKKQVACRPMWRTVFNSRMETVQTWLDLGEGTGASQAGKEIPSYILNGHLYCYVTLPPCSAQPILIHADPKAHKQEKSGFVIPSSQDYRIDNGTLSCLVDQQGVVRNLTYNGRLVAPFLNVLTLYQDVNPDYDAWEIARMSLSQEIGNAHVEEMHLLVDTPSLIVISISLTVSSSKIIQYLTIDFLTTTISVALQVDWHERHKLLKSCFSHSFATEHYLCDTQLGYKELPSHGNTVADRDRYEVCAQSWAAFGDEQLSLMVMNSYPFGLSVQDRQGGVTLLRSALVPDDRSESGMHTLNYAFAIKEGPFSGLVAKNRASLLSHPFPVVDGFAMLASLLSSEGGNAILTAVEVGKDGDLLVRFSNPGKTVERLILSPRMGWEDAVSCTLLETDRETLKKQGQHYLLLLPPFSLRTVLFSLKKAKNA